MRCKVLKGTVDNVATGGEVEIVDNKANRALIAGGVIEPLERLPPEPPPKAPKAPPKSDRSEMERMQREFHGAWDEEQKRHAEELAHLRERHAAELGAALAANERHAAELAALTARLAELEKGAPKGKGKKGEEQSSEKTEG